MTRRWITATAYAATATILALAVLSWLNAPLSSKGELGFIDQVYLCDTLDCVEQDQVRVDLPFRIPRQFDAGTSVTAFVMTLPDQSAMSDQLMLYMPSAPRYVTVTTQEQRGELPSTITSTWRRPHVVEIDPAHRAYRLIAAWPKSEGLTLYPMRFGTRAQLKPYVDQRWTFTSSVAIASLVLTLAIIGISAVIVAAKRDERAFFWLGMSNLPASFIAVMYVRQSDLVSPGYDTALIILAAVFYVSFSLRFVNRLMEVKMPGVERVNLLISVTHAAVLVLVPPGYLVLVSIFFAYSGIVWGLIILVIVLLNPSSMGRGAALGLFTLLTITLSIGLHELIIYTTEIELGPMMLGQALPAVMGTAALWLLVRRLLTSLSGLERLNETLESTVAAKTRELEDSYELVTASQTSAALDEERRRMLIELHDGVGGQITNILAYVEESDAPDPVLEEALDEALREIGVIMDGLSSLQAPLPIVLGGLRHRYEPLLDRLGIAFDWRVSGDNGLPKIAPERKMDFIRLVQEALNNAVKHAQASRITVETQPNALIVQDDGIGLSSERSTAVRTVSSGLGTASMAARAERLGAEVKVEDTGAGTRVTVEWPIQSLRPKN